jgi:hypothetical protein
MVSPDFADARQPASGAEASPTGLDMSAARSARSRLSTRADRTMTAGPPSVATSGDAETRTRPIRHPVG